MENREILEQIKIICSEFNSALIVLADVPEDIPVDDLPLRERLAHKGGNQFKQGIMAHIIYHEGSDILTLSELKDHITELMDENDNITKFMLDNSTHPIAQKYLDIRQRILQMVPELEIEPKQLPKLR